MARQIFYDRLLRDYSSYPRTVVMSTRLIDEVADLLDHVVVINAGKIVIDANAFSTNGGPSGILVHMMVIAIQVMNLTFSSALGLGMTRRDYYLGTAAYFAALSGMYAAGITALAGVESATDGWGVGGVRMGAVAVGRSLSVAGCHPGAWRRAGVAPSGALPAAA